MKDELLSIAQKSNFNLEKKEYRIVLSEPYIPYIPEKWNGVLILAEAQNLSHSFGSYIQELESLALERQERLYLNKEHLGIMPWDDGTMPLALNCIGYNYENTAVCNSVFWSQINDRGNNINPSERLQIESSKLWNDFLDNTEFSKKLKLIVTCGKIARKVIKDTSWDTYSKPLLILRSPSANYLSRISVMFNEKDLLLRYPEVQEQFNFLRSKFELDKYGKNKIFFACHAVSSLND